MKTIDLPYKFLLLFNVLTLLLFSYSPLSSANPGRHWLCVFYISINILAWAIGYKSSKKKWGDKASKRMLPFSGINEKVLNFFFVFYLLTLLPKYAYELAVPVFDINALINRVLIGIYDPGLGYSMARGQLPFNWSIYVLISVIDGIFITVGLLSWKKMTGFLKVLFIFLCIIESLKWFGKGTNFGIIIILVSLLLSYLAQRKESAKPNKKRVAIVVGVFSLMALWVFAHNMEGRSGGDLSSVNSAVFNINTESGLNSFIINTLPDYFSNLYLFTVSYLTGGYTNLECAFDVNAGWSLFMGSNPSKANLAQFILGIDLESMGYPMAISNAFGIDPYINWHSCYAWLANDVGLWGVPIIVFFIGRFTSISLLLYKKNQDLLSGIVFIFLSSMCFFFFANNNYISSIFYSFMLFFPLWLFTRVLKSH